MAQLLRRQTGTVTIAGGASSASASSLPAYAASRSVLVCTVRGGSQDPDDSLVKALKDSTTSILFQRSSTTNALIVDWELLEFDGSVQVQDVLYGGEGSTAINHATLARSFIVSSGYYATGTSQNGVNMYEFLFNSSTSVRHKAQAGTSITGGAIQVVDYQGCSVQAFTNTIAGATTTWNQAITATVTNRTLLWASCFYDGAGTELQFNDVFRIALTSTTNVQGNRETTGAFNQEVTCFVCKHNDWGVQRGSVTQTGGTATSNATLTAVTIARTLSKTVSQHGAVPAYCQSSAASDAYDEVGYTAIMTSTTNLALVRVTTTPTNNIEWEVGEWFGNSNSVIPPQF